MKIDMTSRAQIGKQIRSARKAMGYTQKTLSERTGIHKTTISEIENGHFTGAFYIFESILCAIGLQFEVHKKKRELPNWNEIQAIFAEDD